MSKDNNTPELTAEQVLTKLKTFESFVQTFGDYRKAFERREQAKPLPSAPEAKEETK